jgi:hypothetical protein
MFVHFRNVRRVEYALSEGFYFIAWPLRPDRLPCAICNSDEARAGAA